MAHSRSAWKSLRKSITRRQRNKAVKTHLKTRLKAFAAAVAAADLEKARKQALLLQKSFDKAVTHGVVHKNNASRHKAQAAKAVDKLAAAAKGAK